jgi:hypothetical protein
MHKPLQFATTSLEEGRSSDAVVVEIIFGFLQGKARYVPAICLDKLSHGPGLS